MRKLFILLFCVAVCLGACKKYGASPSQQMENKTSSGQYIPVPESVKKESVKN